MIPVIKHERAFLFNGDSAALKLKPNTIDAIVTDPPAGIEFMGKGWDSDKGGRDNWIKWLATTLKPAFEALKPGGFALVWALPRTSHWTMTALEDLGFEIRDVVMHLFGTGFPKSMNCGDGRGTALKPAAEHWILCRKPLIGTVAKNIAEFGTGALNIDACRIGTTDTWNPSTHGASDSIGTFKTGERVVKQHEAGRWPAHVTLSHNPDCECVGASTETVAKNAEPAGELHSEGWGTRKMSTEGVELTTDVYRCSEGCPIAELGTPAKFFYVAKPTPAERDTGCEALPAKSGGEATDRADDSIGVQNPRAVAGRGGGRRNYHPTVKSQGLMRWLVRLITPPGGWVLDPFTGSGSTAVAALAEGCRFVGCELTAEYIPIIKARIEHALLSGKGSP